MYIYIFMHIYYIESVPCTSGMNPSYMKEPLCDAFQHLYHIYSIVEKSPNTSHLYDHGFMDNTNRQAVCKLQKKII